MKILLRMILAVLVFAALPAAAGAADRASPFDEGNARISLFLGSGKAFDKTYSIFGLGAGYFVADNVEVGLDAETWSGTPRITQVSPQVKYVIRTSGAVNPYAGVFYRRTLIEHFKDFDTVGARAGAFFLTGGNFYLGAGLAGETHLNCNRTVYSDCTEFYPEVLIALVF